MNALASTRPGHVVCVGQAVLDRIYVVQKIPAVPGKARALDMLEVGGGIASNASVAIARLGSPVALWARVGDDVAGHNSRIFAKLTSDLFHHKEGSSPDGF